MLTLQQKLENWDQKSADIIQSIFDEYVNKDGFILELITLVPKPTTETGATWLLKAYLENDGKISNQASAELFSTLSTLNHWEAKLHLLQCLPYLQIETTHKKNVEVFIRESILSKNKFVRAWAYNGFFELSNQYSEFEIDFEQLFENAIETEAPSVKARLRNIQKKRKLSK